MLIHGNISASTLNLIVDDNFKRAAVVLYAKNASLKFVQGMIKMARFKGKDKLGDIFDNQQIYGNCCKNLFAIDTFLSKYLPIASFINLINLNVLINQHCQ